jgi:C4-dicarboxylate transporter DctQ subunit
LSTLPSEALIVTLYRRVVRVLHFVEDGALVSALITMLLIALLQILLRNVFDTGLFWAESFLRILVLWVAMLGAMTATRLDNHISIDALLRVVPDKAKRIITSGVRLIAAAICGAAAWYCLEFVGYEFEDETVAFTFGSLTDGVSVHNWVCQSILPFGFLIIALRLAIGAIFTPPAAATARDVPAVDGDAPALGSDGERS